MLIAKMRYRPATATGTLLYCNYDKSTICKYLLIYAAELMNELVLITY